MTITNYIGLTQLEGHEYYSHIVENENLTKIDNALKENNDRTTVIEEQVVKKLQDFESTILSGSDESIKSVSGSFTGASTVEIKGELAVNLLDLSNSVVAGSHSHNIVTVEVGKTYTFRNGASRFISLYYGEKDDLSTGITSISDGVDFELTPTSNRVSLYLIDGASDTFGETMVFESSKTVSNYFEGMQPLTNPTVTIVNENLFDGEYYQGTVDLNTGEVLNTDNPYTASLNPVFVEGGKDYTFLLEGLSSQNTFYYKSNGDYIGYESNGNYNPALMTTDGYIRMVWTSAWNPDAKVTLVEGDTAPTSYTPHISQTKAYDVKLAKLSNGMGDEINDVKGKTTLTARTNVGRDGQFAIPTSNDITYNNNFACGLVMFDERILSDAITFTNYESYATIVEGFEREVANGSNNLNELANIGSHSTTSDGVLFLLVDKTICPDVSTAQRIYADKVKICYQLAEPVTTVLSHKLDPVMTYGKYTQFIKSSDNFGFDMSVDYPDGLVNAHNTLAESVANMGTALDEHGKLLENGRLMTVDLDWKDSVKSFSDAYNGGVSEITVEGSLVGQLISNGDFSDGLTGHISNGTTSISVVDGIANMLSNMQHGNLYKSVEKKPNRTILAVSRFKSTSHSVTLYVNDGVAQNGVDHSGSGEFETFAVRRVMDASSTTTTVRIQDRRLSGWDTVEVDFYELIDITDDAELMAMTDIQLSKVFSSYFEGLQPTRGVVIESVGRNLLDYSKILNGYVNDSTDLRNPVLNTSDNAYVSFIAKVSRGKTYTFSTSRLVDIVRLAEDNKSITSNINNITSYTMTINSDYALFSLRVPRVGGILKPWEDMNIQLEEGSTPTAYEPHTSSKLVFDDPLAKLPNGSMDKIVRSSDGKTVKYVETNVGRDGGFYIATTPDLNFTTGTNVNKVFFPIDTSFNDAINGDNVDTTKMGTYTVEGFSETIVENNDDASNIGKFYISQSNIVLVVDKTVCPNKDTALALYVDRLKIAYQLATPYTVDLTDKTEILNTYDGYTQMNVEDGFVEGEKVEFYTESGASWYYWNDTNRVPNGAIMSNYKTKSVSRFYEYKNGTVRDITALGAFAYDAGRAYGLVRWHLDKTVAITNNIDTSCIYVDYYTSETNGQANATIKYSADMASSFSQLVKASAVMGEALDKATSEVARLSEPLEWIEPTLLNGWVTWDNSSTKVMRYCKDASGWVHIEGIISSGEISSIIFTLPEDFFNKTKLECFFAFSNGVPARTRINSGGQLIISEGTNDLMSISHSFYVGN